jgi:hypothetical protein
VREGGYRDTRVWYLKVAEKSRTGQGALDPSVMSIYQSGHLSLSQDPFVMSMYPTGHPRLP